MTVIDFGERRRRSAGGEDGNGDDPGDQWVKRQASLVVSQLPADHEEALRVLVWAERIVRYLRGS